MRKKGTTSSPWSWRTPSRERRATCSRSCWRCGRSRSSCATPSRGGRRGLSRTESYTATDRACSVLKSIFCCCCDGLKSIPGSGSSSVLHLHFHLHWCIYLQRWEYICWNKVLLL
uniref:Uncharacterized protein n=1 Tax=Aegilops tauschii subsp. strangulata TaxID=200361 RepID=A0A453IC33_AEGTS